MKFYRQLLAFCLLNAGATAFTVQGPSKRASVALRQADSGAYEITDFSGSDDASDMTVLTGADSTGDDSFEIFPTYEKLEHVEGGGTVRTYPMPAGVVRCQIRLETNGRPLKGEVNVWIGPLRKVHTLKFHTESGVDLPIEYTLTFKKVAPVLRISTSKDQTCPMKVGVHVPSADRSAELLGNTEKLWDNCTPEQKKLVQGGMTDGSKSAVRTWDIPSEAKSIQFLAWSRDSGKKSFKVDFELMRGPNNCMQKYFLQCGGGSQPYHAVFQTPGEGWTLRLENKKWMEDGLVNVAILPYETESYDAADIEW